MNIVQIGCHTGNDHVYNYVSNNNCNNIILIDANPYVLDICKQKYSDIKNTTFCNYAIVPEYLDKNKIVKFYIPEQDKISAHCSVSIDFIKRHNHKQWIEQLVSCMTLDDLLIKYNMYTVDRLYIDAEGLDSKIILSLDLKRFMINYIFFEHMHSDGAFCAGNNLENVLLKLEKNGYALQNRDMYNLEFIKL